MNTQKLTQKTIEAINTAQAMAAENENQSLSDAHLLYTLVDQDGGLIPSIFEKSGVNSNALLSALDSIIAAQPQVHGTSGEVYASKEVAAILSLAEKIAKKMGVAYISVEHLMLAFFS